MKKELKSKLFGLSKFIMAMVFAMLASLLTEAQTSWYVNDNSTVGDVYTSAVGASGNSGTASSPFISITTAIAAASAGDIIYVDGGVYLVQASTTYTVNKALDLRGANYLNDPTVSPSIRVTESRIVVNHSSGRAMTINASGVSVSGFEFDIQLSRDAINVMPTLVAGGTSSLNNLNFTNNIFRSSTTATSQKNGIVFGENNTNANPAGTLDTANITNVTISSNLFDFTTFANSSRGIPMTAQFDWLNYSSFSITNNRFSMGTVNSNGIVGTAVPNRHMMTNYVVTANTFTGYAGIDLTKTSNPIIENNSFSNLNYRAIAVGSANGGVVRGNTIDGTGAALSSGGQFYGYGIDLYGGTDFSTPANGPTGSNGSLLVENNLITNFTHPTEVNQNFRAINVRNNAGPGLIIRNNAIDNVQNGILFATTTANTQTVQNNSITNAVTAIRNNSTQTTIIATCNWFGTASQSAIAAKLVGGVTFSPWLTSGTDTDVAIGFQPGSGTCNGRNPITVFVDAPATASCGSQVTVNIRANGLSDFGTIQFSLNWDSTKLDYVSSSYNPSLYTATGDTPILTHPASIVPPTYADGNFTYLYGDGNPPYNVQIPDSSILMSITFNVLQTGTHSINISGDPTEVLASDPDFEPLPVNVTNGAITVAQPPAPSVLCGQTVTWSANTCQWVVSGTPFSASSSSSSGITCGNSTASITVSANGGSAPYTGTGTFEVGAGANSFIVSDANGCVDTVDVTVQYLPVTNATSGLSYATIQAAITTASAGDVINVCAGTYAEQLTIDKPLTLNGPNSGVPGTGSRVAEAIIEFPSTVANGSSLIKILSNIHDVTIAGFDLRCQDATLPNYLYLITATRSSSTDPAEKWNNLTIRNNRFYSSEIPVYILPDFSANGTGVLVEGNYVNGGPNVNSVYNRGLYVGGTSGIIQDNVVENCNIAIQYMPYGNPNTGLIRRNTVTASNIGLYNNYQTIGAGQVTWEQNVVSAAPNPQTGFATQVDGAATTPRIFNGIYFNTFGTQGTGAAPVALFQNNTINAANPGGTTSTEFRAVYMDNSAAGATANLLNNSFTGYTVGVARNTNATGVTVNATCNWWGTASSSLVATAASSANTYSPWLSSGSDTDAAIGFQPASGTCTAGTPVVIASTSASDITCASGSGSISVSFSGGAAPYSFSWTGGGSAADIMTSPYIITGLTAGSYTVTITDAAGTNVSSSSLTINNLPITNANTGLSYATIQAAITAANPGDVIDICAGTYTASALTINKKLDIRGAGATTIIQNSGGTILTYTSAGSGTSSSDRAYLRNVKLSGASKGILASELVNNLTLENVTIDGVTTYGIHINNTSGVMNNWAISNCTFNGNSAAIYISTAANINGLSVTASSFTNQLSSAFYAGQSSGNPGGLNNLTLSGNTFSNNGPSNNQAALYIEKLSNATISGNTMSNNGLNSNPRAMIINLKYGSFTNVSISGNILSETRGATQTNGYGINVQGRNDASAYNTFPATLSGLTVSSNEISGFLRGIELDNAVDWNSTTVTNNKINACAYGILGVVYGTGNTANAGKTMEVHDNSITGAITAIINANPNSSSINATCNWLGSAASATVASQTSGTVTYSPWLTSGTDTDASIGFQPASGTCTGTAISAVVSSTTNILCNGNSTGAIDITITGGLAPYTYSWSNGAITEDITDLSAGTYTVTITDVNGSTTTATATLTEPAVLTLGADATQIVCNGGTGSVSLSATGGTAPYTYSGDATTSLVEGTYNYTVTDANGCSVSATATINAAPAALILTATASQIICNGGTGSVSLSTSAGTAPYTYGGDATTSLTAGTYNYSVTDVNGCTASTTVTINAAPSAIATSLTASACDSYTLPWGSIVNVNGTYSHVYSASNGCDSTVSIDVTINYSSTDTIWTNVCNNNLPYVWNGNSYSSSGTYVYNSTRVNGCDSVVYLVLTVNLTNSSSVSRSICAGQLPYTWNEVTFTSAGVKTAVLTNTSGCDSTVTMTLIVSASTPVAPVSFVQTLLVNNCGARTYRFTSGNVTGANGYSWILPTSVGGVSGVTVDSGDINSSRIIRLTFASNNAALITDSIKVRAYNGCGNGPIKGVRLTNGAWTPLPSPVITTTNLITNVCGGRKVRYSIPEPATTSGPVSIEWSFVGSVLGANALIDSGSVSSRTIVVLFTNNSEAAANDSVKVRHNFNNGCRFGAYSRTKIGLTSLSGSITGTPTISATNVNINTCGARKVRYTASALTGTATGYSWSFVGNTLGANATIDSGTSSSKTIVVLFTSNAASSTTDSVRCRFISDCGSGANGKLRIVLSVLNPPPTPASITITPVSISSCGLKTYRYSAPALVSASSSASTAAATGWLWSFTGSLGANATIDSGSLTSRVILVSFTSNSAALTGDSVKVRYNSDCGLGANRAAKLTNVVLNAPLTPSSITTTAVQTNVCGARIYRYSAPALPIGTATNATATGYLWSFTGTLGSNAIIDSGNTNSRIIRVRYTLNSGSATGDSVRVRYTSSCGSSPNRSTRLTNVALSGCPPSITSKIPVSSSFELEVYPNPSHGQFTLKLNGIGSEDMVIRIMDLQGRLVRRIISAPNSNINVGSDLKAGAYLLEVRQGKFNSTKRLIKL